MSTKIFIIIAVILGIAAALTCFYLPGICVKDTCDKNCSSESDSNLKNENGTALTCKLTTPELQKRKASSIAALKNKQLEKKEMPNGFAFRYDGSDENIDLLAEFIKSERQCCDFFSFTFDLKSNKELWLHITGPEGVKDFIRTELEM